jgi:integrase
MGEVRALEVRDVDLERGRLLVRRAFSSDEVMSPKSGDERVVPLNPELLQILTEAVSTEAAERARGDQRARSNADASTRTEGVQGAAGEARAQGAFVSLLASLLLLRAHPTRREHRRGRVLAGHSKLDITQRYVHANAADLTAAIAKLPGN